MGKTVPYFVLTDRRHEVTTYNYYLKGNNNITAEITAYDNGGTYLGLDVEAYGDIVTPSYFNDIITMIEAVRDHYEEIEANKTNKGDKK